MVVVIVQQLCSNKVGLGALFCMGTEEIGKEKDFQDNEDDEQLDGNDQPQRFPQRHAAETIVVQAEGSVKETVVCHKLQVISVGKDRYYFPNCQKKG